MGREIGKGVGATLHDLPPIRPTAVSTSIEARYRSIQAKRVYGECFLFRTAADVLYAVPSQAIGPEELGRNQVKMLTEEK